TTDPLGAGTNPIDRLNYPLLGGPDSDQTARHLLEEQLHFQNHDLRGLHQSHSSRGHGHTIGQNSQGDCGANNVTSSTLDHGHPGHRDNKRLKTPPPSTTSCPPPHPANGGDGIGSNAPRGGNAPPGGNNDPTGSFGSDSSGLWLADPFVPNDPPGVPE